jgi:hypothetical protein
MTDVFIDSTAVGSNTGVDWANAYNAGTQVDWNNAATDASAAVDRVIVASDNATVLTGNLSLTVNANHTLFDPLEIIVSASGSGTTVAPVSDHGTAGNGEISGASNFDINFNGFVYIHGLRMINMDASSLDGVGDPLVLEKCFYGMTKTLSAENFIIASGSSVTWIDCDIEMSGNNHNFLIGTDSPSIKMIGGSFTTDSNVARIINIASGKSVDAQFFNVDMTGIDAATDLAQGVTNEGIVATYYNCKWNSTMPTLWGSTITNLKQLSRIIATGPDFEIAAQYSNGNLLDETTIRRAGGADTGSQTYSIKFESTSNAVRNQPMRHLFRVENPGDLDTLTVKLHFANNQGALTDDQIWIETSAADSTTIISETDRNLLGASATTHTDESGNVDWRDGAGALTGYNEQSCEVTFSTTTAGPIWVSLCVAADFTTTNNLYVDPKLVIA